MITGRILLSWIVFKKETKFSYYLICIIKFSYEEYVLALGALF